ncbi:hypothetical protein GCM10023192_69630 [Amycolatopsis samaneae]
MPDPSFLVRQRAGADHGGQCGEVRVVGKVDRAPAGGTQAAFTGGQPHRRRFAVAGGDLLYEDGLEHADGGDRGDEIRQLRRRGAVPGCPSLHLGERGAVAALRQQREAALPQPR